MMTKIFKTLAFAALLLTACNRETIDTENIDKKGYPLPVTVNVTRQDDNEVTKATYNDGTKKLSFSTGDKLFVFGHDGRYQGAGQYAGMLTWTSGGSFSGTIYTSAEYSGTADELFTAIQSPGYVEATLLPAGYEDYGFLFDGGEGSDTYVGLDFNEAFALTKAAAVEQFSGEGAKSYSSGFALSPTYPILNVTITDLPKTTEVTVSLSYSYGEAPGVVPVSINKNVTTDGSGNATFAVGVNCTNTSAIYLTVWGKTITLGSHDLVAGKIYNVTRSVLRVLDICGLANIYYLPGETWGAAINNHPINGSNGWEIVYDSFILWEGLFLYAGGGCVITSEEIDPGVGYSLDI